MGVILQDQVDMLSIGMPLKNLYFAISGQMIYLQRFTEHYGQKSVTKYRYHCSFEIYANYEAKQANKQYLKTIYVEAIVNHNHMDPYTLMYDQLKKTMNNYVDVL